MQEVGVRFSGNGAGAIGAAKETAAAIDKVTATAKVSAAETVKKAAEQRQALAVLAAEYRGLAASAEKGSIQQVAALRLAGDAERKLAAEHRTAGLAARGQTGELNKLERGALAGSGAFRGLGRSVAFASGAFIGAAGFVEVVKQSIDVVLRSQTSIAHLDQAVRDAHASVKALTPIFEAQAAASAKLGFQDDDTRDAEAKLVTAFGATKQALAELSVAQDLARASNIPLGDATRQLILLQEGNTRAAKQFGLSLPDLTKKQWEAKAAADGLNLSQEKGKTLYDELLPRIKNQAAAYAATPAGKIAEFHAEITHLQESIGTGLLPVVDKYLTKIDDWLAKGSNQRKVTKDVRNVVEELAAVLGDAKDATKKFLDYADPVVKTLGGWKNVIEVMIGLKFASVIAGWGAEMKTTAERAGLLNGRLNVLSGLLSKPFQFIVAYEIIKKITGSNADLSNNAGGPGDLLPVYQNGKWVDPQTGIAVADQAYWNNYYKKSGGTGKPSAGQTAGGPSGTAKQRAIVSTAEALGPSSGGIYVRGGTGAPVVGTVGSGGVTFVPGFDCSGYLYDIYKKNGITIPRTSEAQWNDPDATHVPKGQEQPGDGVYFTGSSEYAPPGHCGIYVGGGKYISYYQSGKPAAVFDLANASDYWGARRWVKIVQAGGDGGKKSPFGPSTQTGGGGSPTPPKTKWVGATAATITSAQGTVSALLRGLPANLDPVEKNAVAHIEAIQDALRIHMTPDELAKDKVELTRWGKVLHEEITKNAKIAATAAAEAKKVFDRALSLDVSHVLRDFDQNFAAQMQVFDRETSRSLHDMQTNFARQQKLFDRETQKGLQALVVKQTPEEKALADFLAARASGDLAKSRADQLANASTPEEKAALSLGFSLDDQQAALQTSADQSRVAQDAKTAADQQAYQDQRDAAQQAAQDKESDAEQAYSDQRAAAKQAQQNINDDQRTLLQNNLDDWVANLEAKKKSWADFVAWLKANGFDTGSLINPNNAASLNDPAGAVSPGGDPRGSVRLGAAIGFAGGGKVPGTFVGRQDTLMARLTPGEHVTDRRLTAAMEDFFLGGAGGGFRIVAGDVYLDGQKVGQHVARGVTDAQERQIGYTTQRS